MIEPEIFGNDKEIGRKTDDVSARFLYQGKNASNFHISDCTHVVDVAFPVIVVMFFFGREFKGMVCGVIRT